MKTFHSTPMPAQRTRDSRRGFTTPAVAVALLVTMAGLALILDRLWLDAADLELTTAAEAAALAAASELASDDLLRLDADPELRFERARASAAWIASQNLVAGDPVVINTDPEGDIRLGRLVADDQSGQVQFQATSKNPTTAVVTALRTRRSSNPVGLFVSGVTGQPHGDIASRVEASVDNRVTGVRPQEGTPVPAFPLAIWLRDPAGQRVDTWETQIEARRGPDEFGYDPVDRRVYRGSDGIPEIVLHSQARQQPSANSNVLIVDLGTRLNDRALGEQFRSGWSVQDLASFDGELRVTASAPALLRASAELRHADREALDELIGEPRICMLYSTAMPSGTGAELQATCVRLVAIRVLAVRDQGDGSCDLVVQPCIVKTRTAVLDVPSPYSTDGMIAVQPYSTATDSSAARSTNSSGTTTGTTTPGVNKTATDTGNPYIYKLHLTH
jgi:hypothetical protein